MSMDEFIPEGFSPLAKWDSRNRRTNDGHTAEWKALSDAVKQGEIPGFKLSNGRWYVHEQKANQFLLDGVHRVTEQAVSRKATPSASADVHAESVCKSLAGMEERLDEIYVILERLAVAAESIATQPKASDVEGSWRGVNGECV